MPIEYRIGRQSNLTKTFFEETEKMRKLNKIATSATFATIMLIGTTVAQASDGGDGGVIVGFVDSVLAAFGVIVG